MATRDGQTGGTSPSLVSRSGEQCPVPVRVPERCPRDTGAAGTAAVRGCRRVLCRSRQAGPAPDKSAASDPGPGARWGRGRPLLRRHSAALLPKCLPSRTRSRRRCGRGRAGPCLAAPGGAGRGRGAERREERRGCGAAVARHGPARGDAARYGRCCLLPGRDVPRDGRQEAGREERDRVGGTLRRRSEPGPAPGARQAPGTG